MIKVCASISCLIGLYFDSVSNSMLDKLIHFFSFSQEVAKEPAKEQVKDNVNMFGAAAITPSAEDGGHGQLHRPQEPAEVGAHDQLQRLEEHAPKKANPFV